MYRDFSQGNTRSYSRGASHIVVAAAVSVAVLLAAIGAQLGLYTAPTAVSTETKPIQVPSYVEISDADGNGTPDWMDELEKAGIALNATSSLESEALDPLSYIGETVARSLMDNYLSAKESGEFNSETGNLIANSIATNIVKAPNTYSPHTKADITIKSDSSAESIEAYRLDMQRATAVLLTDAEPEFALFGRYMETNDPYWLDEIQKSRGRYRQVEIEMQALRVPESASVYHVRALNAIGAYGHTLERLIRFADDSIAVLALLRAYNEVEREMVLAFDALAQFYVRSASGQ